MDDREDPSTLLFGTTTVELYAVLSVNDDADADAIKKAYRRLALVHHPDRHAAKDEAARAVESLKFQQVGFAYAVLSDEKRRARYDKTGRTDEGFEDVGEDGWEAYFADLFEQVTKAKLDDMKREYQGTLCLLVWVYGAR
jgi:DnaJ family protein C protein 9